MQQHGFTSETALDVLANVPVPTTVVLAAKHEVGSAATSCSGSFTVEVVGAR